MLGTERTLILLLNFFIISVSVAWNDELGMDLMWGEKVQLIEFVDIAQ